MNLHELDSDCVHTCLAEVGKDWDFDTPYAAFVAQRACVLKCPPAKKEDHDAGDQ